MKTTLSYEFNIPEELDEYITIQNAWKHKRFIDEMFGFLRKCRKYEDPKPTSEEEFDHINDGIFKLYKEYVLDYEES